MEDCFKKVSDSHDTRCVTSCTGTSSNSTSNNDHIAAIEKQVSTDPVSVMTTDETVNECHPETTTVYLKDIGTWESPLPDRMAEFWIARGSKDCQQIDLDGRFRESGHCCSNETRPRFCKLSYFTRIARTGEKVDRKWLCYSKSTGKLYCFACKVTGKTVSIFVNRFHK